MLFKTLDKVSGKVLKTSRPLLVTPQQAYVRPQQGKDWRTLDNLSNYQISEFGEVRRSILTNPKSRGWSCKKPGDLLVPASKGKRYPTLVLVQDDGKYATYNIHTLVALAFLGKRPNGKNALHKDDNGHNNHVSNIYWGTQSQNNADMRRNGHALIGEKHPNCRHSDKRIKEIKILYSKGMTQHQIAKKFDMSQSTVSMYVREKRRV